MKRSAENGDLLPVGTEQEYYSNEAFETMVLNKVIKYGIIVFLTYFAFGIVIFLMPKKDNISTREFSISPNTTDVTLQFVYEEKKTYQPYLNLTFDYAAPNGPPVVLNTKLSVDIYRGTTLFSSLDMPKNTYRMYAGQSYSIYSGSDIEATKIDVHGTMSLLSGSYNCLTAKWIHFNSSYAYYVIMLFIILSALLFCAGSLITYTILKLKVSIPTIACKYILLCFFVLIVSIVPIPELVYFDILFSARNLHWLFTAFYRALFLVAANTVCWNLYYRNDNDEKKLYLASIPIFICVFIVFVLHKIVPDPDNLFRDFIPILIILGLMAYSFRIPFLIGRKSDIFNGSILHLLIILPAEAIMLICLTNGASRFDQIEVYARTVLPLSMMFLAFLHWPFEEVVIELENNV